jgi:5-methylcytosine-specific restriction endonuclease McrA
MAKRTPPFDKYPVWSQAKFWGFIRSVLRAASNKYPPKYEAKKNARRKYEGDDKRVKWEYQCYKCRDWFKDKQTQIDHIIPVGSLRCYDDLSGFVARMFCGVDGFGVICKECHKKKTNQERLVKK